MAGAGKDLGIQRSMYCLRGVRRNRLSLFAFCRVTHAILEAVSYTVPCAFVLYSASGPYLWPCGARSSSRKGLSKSMTPSSTQRLSTRILLFLPTTTKRPNGCGPVFATRTFMATRITRACVCARDARGPASGPWTTPVPTGTCSPASDVSPASKRVRRNRW